MARLHQGNRAISKCLLQDFGPCRLRRSQAMDYRRSAAVRCTYDRQFRLDRVLLGSDWPVCTLSASYQQWVEALQTIVQEVGEIDQRKIVL